MILQLASRWVHLPFRRGVRSQTRRRRSFAHWAIQPLEHRQIMSVAPGLLPPGGVPATVRPIKVPASAPLTADTVSGSGFVPMFNGVNTAGWINPYDWGRAVAKNGQILLTGTKGFFLVSKQTYQNFIVEADVWIPPGGNSGLQFRSRYGHNFMQGYQADMDTNPTRNWAGGLWFQYRGWLAHAKPRARVKAGQWNHYEVEAIGNHIVITVNGTVTVNTYENIYSAGHVALQDHGSPGVYRFKNVEIEVLS